MGDASELGIKTVAAKKVFSYSYGLKVCRVDATPMETLVTTDAS